MSQLFNAKVVDVKQTKNPEFVNLLLHEIQEAKDGVMVASRVRKAWGVFPKDYGSAKIITGLSYERLTSQTPFYDGDVPFEDGLYYQNRFMIPRVESKLVDGAEYSEAAALRKAERAARREKSFTGTEGLPQ